MSEDRLEQALEALRGEHATPEQVAAAGMRVRERLGIPGTGACLEFSSCFGDYLAGRLPDSRRLLMDDHLSRCPQCRAQLARQKGERKVVPMPFRRIYRWSPWQGWAVAAALLVALLYAGRDRIDTMLAPSGPRASVVSVRGSVFRVPEGVLQEGAALDQSDVVRTAPGARAVLRLADGSLVDVNERTELSVNAAWSGQTIRLQRGDIIVQAARQHRGHLRVQTRDSVASVKGTVFAVSAGFSGTVVSVVEGSVAVTQPGVDVVLRPGQQASSGAAVSYSVQDAVSWSPDAEKYLALLASFADLEKQIAKLPPSPLRTQSRLLQLLPANPIVYGALPNLGGTIRQAMALAEQQSVEDPIFREWWNSSAGRELNQIVERIQSVTPLLGDEIVFVFSTSAPDAKDQIPMVAAEVAPEKQAELAAALEALRGESGDAMLPVSLTASLLLVSDSQDHLQWVLAHMGQGAGTPFAAEIATRYQRGAGWLLGMNVAPAISALGSNEAELAGAGEMKHLLIEQRDIQGAEENEVTLTFNGPRVGMASWLASAGSGGAAEYISSDAIFALYASTREPRQLFEELTAQLSKLNASGGKAFDEIDAKLGAGFASDLAAAFGTESAFALDGFSTTGPVWVMAALVNNPSTIDNSIRRLADVFNSELAPAEQAKRIAISQETVDGRTWQIMKSGAVALSVTWTYDHGYMVAASDRGEAVRAITARDGGSALVWSPVFQQQMPSSAGLHPSAFAWLNTKGVLEGLAQMVSNPTIQKLVAAREPILVVFSGTTEQIHAASRTRISGLIVDVMLLESLSGTRGGQQVPFLQRGSPGIR